jgi:lichenan operon transcriptional antiterminator
MQRRKDQILLFLYNHSGEYVTSAQLSNAIKASVRTIKNDMADLFIVVNKIGGRIKSIPSKGYLLEVQDQDTFEKYIHSISDKLNNVINFNDPMFRIHYMLNTLIRTDQYYPAKKFMNEMFVSRSTISNDLLHLKTLLKNYGLTLDSRPNKGLKIVGDERDKRRCIIREGFPKGSWSQETLGSIINDLRDDTLGILIKEHYEVSDIVFQNLILHIALAVERMKNGFIVKNDIPSLSKEFHHVLKISEQIMRTVCERYELSYDQAESNFLAINLQGKRELDNPNYINKEINDFVFHALKEIKEIYHIDLLQDTRLRIALALHTLPLITRVQEHSQINNVMKYNIKQTYPFAYDLATNFAYQLQKTYGTKLIDDEISYLAIHFSLSLNSAPEKTGKKILLVSAQKPSDTILIQQKIYQWFQNQISIFDIINSLKLNTINQQEYDTIFTTEKSLAEKYRNMVLIPYFLTNLDYSRVELAVNGFHDVNSILNKFSCDLFFFSEETNKEIIISQMCAEAEKKHYCSDSLLSSVMFHEQIVSTYFGNNVAMPHPDTLVSEETFIAVSVLKEQVKWNENEPVQLVLLVSIEKNNPKAYQLWYYLSYLISNNDAIKKIIENPSFDNFENTIRSVYSQF